MKKGLPIVLLTEKLAAIIFIFIGLINLFWGNDPFYGIFILLLSQVFFAPVRNRFLSLTGVAIAGWVRILLALFIIWSSVGVGELDDKVNMMLESFKSI